MDKKTDTELLNAIDALMRETKISPSNFGTEAVNDANLVFQLRAGRDLRTSTRSKVFNCIDRLLVAHKAGKQSDVCQGMVSITPTIEVQQ